MSPGSKIALALFVLALMAYLPYYVVKHDSGQEHKQLQARVERMRSDNEAVRRQNERLERHLSNLHEHPGLLERYARERLVLARPDELILVFPEEPQAPAALEEPSQAGPAQAARPQP